MPLECTQAYFGCAACEDGTIYAVGGHDGHTFLHTAEVYTPSTGTWQPIASLRSARAYLGLEVVGGQLYAIGGHDGDARVRTVERYDPPTDTWQLVAPMHSVRAFLATVSTGGTIVAIGGSDAPGHALASCESYDVASDTWRPIEQPMLEARCFPGAAVVCRG